MDVIMVLRLGYLSASALVLLVALVAPLRTRFLAYGARTSPISPSTHKAQEKADAAKGRQAGTVTVLLDRLAALRVPHSWFTSFYLVCVACSLLWATQVLTRGPLFRAVARSTGPRGGTMTVRQVAVTWTLLFVQGSRRLYESFEFARPSRSKMWFVHWVLGVGFYTATSMAVWVEGIPAVQHHTFSLDDIAITGPSLRTFASILLFILASGFQHDCHAYLASLKPSTSMSPSSKSETDPNHYKLPEHPAFLCLIAPHYFVECLIYVSLTLIAAPQGAWLNGTLACALAFVVVNLGATADVTRSWYEGRFGREAVGGRWRMVPFVW